MTIHYAPPLEFDVSQIVGLGDPGGKRAHDIVQQIITSHTRYLEEFGSRVTFTNSIAVYQRIAKALDDSLDADGSYHICDLRFQVRNELERHIKSLRSALETIPESPKARPIRP